MTDPSTPTYRTVVAREEDQARFEYLYGPFNDDTDAWMPVTETIWQDAA